MKNHIVGILLLVGCLLVSIPYSAYACSGSGFTLVSMVDNMDGTFTSEVEVCVGGLGTGAQGITHGFFFDVEGANILSFSPASLTNDQNGETINGSIQGGGNLVQYGNPTSNSITFLDPSVHNTRCFTFFVTYDAYPEVWIGGGLEDNNCPGGPGTGDNYTGFFPLEAQYCSGAFGAGIPDPADQQYYTLEAPLINDDPGAPLLGSGTELFSVCVLIDHQFLEDIDIYLTCPSGTTIELSTDNGGQSNDYGDINSSQEVCFSSQVGETSITNYQGGQLGYFLPEQDFSALDGCDPDGTWTLSVDDDENGAKGTLVSWSIGFDSGSSSPCEPPCDADVGTFSTSSNIVANAVNLCQGEEAVINSNNDYVLPLPVLGEEAELMYAIYDCPPPATPDPTLPDACFSGVFWPQQNFSETNAGGGIPFNLLAGGVTGTDNTIWLVPITMDNGDNNANPDGLVEVDGNGDSCFDTGAPYEIKFLPGLIIDDVSSCDTVGGSFIGALELYVASGGGVPYTVVNNGAGTLAGNPDNPILTEGGGIILTGLVDADLVDVDIIDAEGCVTNFTQSFVCANDVCLVDADLIATPPPVNFPNSQYPPGTTVEFCFSINRFNQTALNFLHGIVPSFGSGWDASSLTPTTFPVSTANGEPYGSWNWYPPGTVSGNNGTLDPTDDVVIQEYGWFFETPNGAIPGDPTDPNDNFGDGCSSVCYPGPEAGPNIDSLTCVALGFTEWIAGCGCSTNAEDVGGNPFPIWVGPNLSSDIIEPTMTQTYCESLGGEWVNPAGTGQTCSIWGACLGNIDTGFGFAWTACFELTSNSATDCSVGESLAVSVETFGDGETGAWVEIACTADVPFVSDPGPPCCIDPPIASNQVFCEGSAIEVVAIPSVPGNTINWYNVATGGIPLASDTLAYAPGELLPGTYTFWLEEDANGCFSIGRTDILVTIEPLPIIDFIQGDTAICLGEAATLELGITTPVGDPATVLWSPGGMTADLVNVSPVATTIYTAAVTNSCGTREVSIRVTVSDPEVTLNGFDLVCSGDQSGGIATTISGGVAPYSYSWSDPTIGDVKDPIDLNAGIYTVTVTDAVGCTVSATEPLLPEPFFALPSPDRTLCVGHTAYLASSAMGGFAPYTYEWDNGLGADSTHAVLVSGTLPVVYTVTVTDANLCTATGQITITPTPDNPPSITCPPDVNSGTDPGACEGTVALPPSTTTDDCPPDVITGTNGVLLNYYGMYNGSYYYVTSSDVTPADLGVASEAAAFAAVQATAAEFGGNIATIDNALENSFVEQMGYFFGNLMIGFNDASAEGTFVWEDGTPTGYNNWDPLQPDNAGIGGEDYTQVTVNEALWDDYSMLNEGNPAVVEFATMPEDVTVSCVPDGSSPFPEGSTSVTCTAEDWAGNTASCSFNVIVTDDQAPDPVCQNFTVQLDSFSGVVTITGVDIDNGSSDNCSSVTFSVSPNVFSCDELGDNTVTLTVTDAEGNSATCTAVVTVLGPPVVFDRD